MPAYVVSLCMLLHQSEGSLAEIEPMVRGFGEQYISCASPSFASPLDKAVVRHTPRLLLSTLAVVMLMHTCTHAHRDRARSVDGPQQSTRSLPG